MKTDYTLQARVILKEDYPRYIDMSDSEGDFTLIMGAVVNGKVAYEEYMYCNLVENEINDTAIRDRLNCFKQAAENVINPTLSDSEMLLLNNLIVCEGFQVVK